jgi:hypothetical protein
VDDDIIAQKRFTEAIKDLIERRIPHECRLENASLGLDYLFGCYKSALLGRRIESTELDFNLQAWNKLYLKLKGESDEQRETTDSGIHLEGSGIRDDS